MPLEDLPMNVSNCFAYTATNQRDNNEDYQSVFLLPYAADAPPIVVLVVADGMGGHDHGEDVSRQVVLKIREFLNESVERLSRTTSFDGENLKVLLFKALQSANNLVLRMVAVNGWKQAGSTIVVAAIWGNRVIATNLGDSPLFHYVACQKKAIRVSQDHSVPGILAQANLISEEMARYHERRGQLEYFLGADTLPPTEPVYERRLEPGDLLLLCSDGVTGLLRLEQIEAILAHPTTDLRQKANHLIHTARSLGETDNQTLILWRYARPAERLNSTASSEQISDAPRSPSSGFTLPANSSSLYQEQTVIQPSEDSTSVLTDSSTVESRTVQLVYSPRRSKRTCRRLGLITVLAVLGVLVTGYLLYALLSPLFHLVPKEMKSNGQPPVPLMTQPQPPPNPIPGQLAPPTTPEIPTAKSAPYTNEAGLTIAGFTNGGAVLTTKGIDGTLRQWKIAETKGQTACPAPVLKEFEPQQRILAVTPRQGSMFKSLLTLGENNCMRQWLILQGQQNLFDELKNILHTVFNRG